MADFCEGCMTERLGMPEGAPGDLAGITTAAEEAAGRFAAVLCEGCGPIRVDRAGRRVGPPARTGAGRRGGGAAG